MTDYSRSMDPGAKAPQDRAPGLDQSGRQSQMGTSLQDASRPITGMGETTNAPNRLPAPSATAGATMGSKPGAKPASNPGTFRQTGAASRD